MCCCARLLAFGTVAVLGTVSALPAAPTMTLAGRGFTIEKFDEGARAFGNRDYTWQQVPKALKGWRFTRMNGGEAAPLWLRCHRDMEVLLATSAAASDWQLAGWELVPDWTFCYTDRGRTKVRVYRRRLPAGPVVPLPQTGWTGGMLLIPPEAKVEVVGPLPGLQRLKYNHPGLVVDLGVGLWAWPLPMDYDNDGDMDLVVCCHCVPYGGTYFFENPGGGKMPVFKAARKVGPPLRNVCPSYVDGRVRLLVPGQELVHFRQNGFAQRKQVYPKSNVHPNRVRANQWKYVDYDGDGRLDLAVGVGDWTDYGWDNAFDSQGRWTRGPLHGYVYLLRNQGTNEHPRYDSPAKLEAGGRPIDVFGMPSPNFADFDGDGDLDLLCGEFVDSFTYFENIGSRTQPRYAAGRKLMLGDRPLTMDLCMIVPVAVDWDRDGDIDLVVGQEDGRVALVEHTGRVERGLPVFAAPRFFQQEADEVKFGALATPVGFDWDGDGDEDIVTGNTAGYVGFIENLGPASGSDTPKWAAPVLLEAGGRTLRIMAGPNGSIQGPCEAKWGYTTLSVADWDHDGLPDLVVNSIWGRVVWYRNIGTRSRPKLAAAEPIRVAWSGSPPKPAWNWWNPKDNELATQWRTTPVVIDLNGDGLNDLVMLDHEGYLAFFERKRVDDQLTLLPPRRIFRMTRAAVREARHRVRDPKGGLMRLNSGVAGRSGRRKLCFTDWDGDGAVDLLVNSVNVNFLRNVSADGASWTFEDLGPIGHLRLAGHTTSPTTVDWNSDGRPDLLIGAEDGYFYYLPNPTLQRADSQ